MGIAGRSESAVDRSLEKNLSNQIKELGTLRNLKHY